MGGGRGGKGKRGRGERLELGCIHRVTTARSAWTTRTAPRVIAEIHNASTIHRRTVEIVEIDVRTAIDTVSVERETNKTDVVFQESYEAITQFNGKTSSPTTDSVHSRNPFAAH